MTDFIFDANHTIWVEKYRPLTINDCIIPQRVKDIFNGYLEKGDFPSLLLDGSSGIGKTTVARALTHELGMDTMLINVSNERGIDVLRTKITDFATTVSLDGGVKCIVLDEFDGATELLQNALRAAIEEYSINCRFILTCNHPNRIRDAIHSRTARVDLKVTKEETIEICKMFLNRLIKILKTEGIEYERQAVAKLIQKNFPDFRSIINQLQHMSALGKIDMEMVEADNTELSITKLSKALKAKNFKDMRQWVSTNANSDPSILFRKVYEHLGDILQPSSIPEVIVILAQYMHYSVTSIDPEINLVACFTEIMAVGEFI